MKALSRTELREFAKYIFKELEILGVEYSDERRIVLTNRALEKYFQHRGFVRRS